MDKKLENLLNIFGLHVNILVRDSAIVGLIDFSSAHSGSADLDFTSLPAAKQSFLDGYKTVRDLPDIDRSLEFYDFFTAFTRIGWCVKRGKTDEDFFREFLVQLDYITNNFKGD
ncbi:MAG: hypothetical protein FWB80_04770 [Defluviitaleaceae bacterium]|nr:hypothetical protein [Defluviitaleaceae bacterium]